MEKRERGAISVEASIILMIFLFGMLALLGMINMVRTQVVIQNALNQSAKEVSQYSYIMYRMGYLDYLKDTQANKNNFEEQIQKYASPGDAATAKNNLVGLMEQFSNDGGSSLVDELVYGIFAEASATVTNTVNNQVIQMFAKSSMENYISTLGNGSDYLKKCGIVNGLQGLSYSGTYCSDENREIVICVDYKMEYKFPFIAISFEIPIHLSAVTTAWAGGVK